MSGQSQHLGVGDNHVGFGKNKTQKRKQQIKTHKNAQAHTNAHRHTSLSQDDVMMLGTDEELVTHGGAWVGIPASTATACAAAVWEDRSAPTTATAPRATRSRVAFRAMSPTLGGPTIHKVPRGGLRPGGLR